MPEAADGRIVQDHHRREPAWRRHQREGALVGIEGPVVDTAAGVRCLIHLLNREVSRGWVAWAVFTLHCIESQPGKGT